MILRFFFLLVFACARTNMSNFLFKKKVLKHILYNEEKFHINSA